MKIIGIDPGPTESGFVWLVNGKVVQAETIANADLRRSLDSVLYGTVVGIEQVRSYGMSVGADVFDTCVETGRFFEVASTRGAAVHLIPRMDVKMHLCHSPKAKDSNIRQALIDRYGANSHRKGGPLYGVSKHAWAALAVAVTLADRLAIKEAA